jgi:hypothetical protein
MHSARPDELPDGCNRAALAPLLKTLAERPWDVDRKVLILYPRVYALLRRLAQRVAADGGDGERAFGFERPIQAAGPGLLKKFVDLTARARFPWAVADTRLPLEVIRRFALVVCPALEVLSAEAMTKLDAYVAGGGFLAIGPRIPLLDETMRPRDTLARHFAEGLSEFALEIRHVGQGAFLTLPGYVSAATIEFLAFEAGLARGLTADAPGLDTAVHRSGVARLMFVANPADRALATTFSGEALAALRNVETREEMTVSAGHTLTLPPRAVSVWEVA